MAADLSSLLQAASNLLDQSSPPSLRDILSAYRTKGDGDRDMLLAMLNAKAAEDQRLANMASLQRTVLDLYASTPAPRHTYSYSQSSQDHISHRSHHGPSRSPSPPHHHHRHHLHPVHPYAYEPSRKRSRRSHSPDASQQRNLPLPPSPYSPHSSGSDMGPDYSPQQGRMSMAIGSLLSSGMHETQVNGRVHERSRSLDRERNREPLPQRC